MPTTTNFGWTTPADTDLVKDGAAAIRTLAGNIDTSLVDLKGGATGEILKKNSATDLDFVWSGAGGLSLISETTASASTSINFTSIPATYKQLMLVWSGLYPSNSTSVFALRFNNDSTAAIYQGVASSRGDAGAFSATNADDGNGQLGLFGYNASTTSTDYQDQSKGFVLLDNYASTSKFKTYKGNASWLQLAVAYRQSIVTGVYKSLSAITSVDIVRLSGAGTLTNATSTSIRLYGIA